MDQIIMIWFWYGNSVFKFYTFYLQSGIFTLQVFDYYVLQIDNLTFQTVNALWTMDCSNLSNESRLISVVLFCFWFYDRGTKYKIQISIIINQLNHDSLSRSSVGYNNHQIIFNINEFIDWNLTLWINKFKKMNNQYLILITNIRLNVTLDHMGEL